MTEQPNREVAVLNATLELRPEQRAAYLDEVCAGDAKLREQVETLLQAHDQAEGFLDAPPFALDFQRTVKVSFTLTERPGDKIGRYKLLQQIGEGGCGVVYMAKQEEPVRRRVALKVIRLGMDTKQVIARFEAERQALALMDHPNIAKVLDAGATETGRPYFVMELVRGVKITEFCDENKLSTAERLKLFIQVCQAIQHAHQKGVIHRDIKPSNILVTVNDGVPVPKVIDFGIAKATQGRLTDQTLFTAFEQFIGTPAYMSPEQAVMTSLDIDTRSDIYSLGVLLYELITGRTPFDQKELLAAGLDEMRRTIREVEPVKPSKVVERESKLRVERTGVRGIGGSTLNSQLQSLSTDLDWIAMKCLEKDRARRYETANGLAADIQRHLSNEPVNARPPSGLYRVQKAIRRNKTAFATAAAIAAVLVIGAIASTWQAIRATRAEREQTRLREVAETNEKKSDQVAQFLKDMLKGAGPSVARGRDATVLREILDNTSQRIARDMSNQPEVQADLWVTIGSAYGDIGDSKRAGTNLQLAVDGYRLAFRGNNNKLARALGYLGLCQSLVGNVSAGRTNSQLGLAMARAGGDCATVAKCLFYIGRSCKPWGQCCEEAVPYLREALNLWNQLGTSNSECISFLACCLANTDEAESLMREALALDRKEFGDNHPKISNGLFGLGQNLLNRDKPEEAEKVFRETLELNGQLKHDEWPFKLMTRHFLMEALARQKKWDGAEALVREEMAAPQTKAEAWNRLVRLKVCRGDWPAAMEAAERGLQENPKDVYLLLSQGVIFLQTKHFDDYRRNREELLKDFASNYWRFKIARLALLSPAEGTDLERACRIADSVETETNAAQITREMNLTKALAEYRRGRFNSAKNWAERVTAEKCACAEDAQAWFIQALSNARLQQEAPAQKALAKGEKRLKQPHTDFNPHEAGGWGEWTVAELLESEAKRLVEAQLTGEDR